MLLGIYVKLTQAATHHNHSIPNGKDKTIHNFFDDIKRLLM